MLDLRIFRKHFISLNKQSSRLRGYLVTKLPLQQISVNVVFVIPIYLTKSEVPQGSSFGPLFFYHFHQ